MNLTSFILAAATGAVLLPTGPLPSAVYHAPAPAGTGRLTTQPILKGSTLDLSDLDISLLTLPAGQAVPALVSGAEELLVVQEGQLTALVRDSTKTLGPGGVVLATAGDQPALRNRSTAPARCWVLRFRATDGADAARFYAAGGAYLRDWASFRVIKTDKGETRPVFDRPSAMFKRFDVHATVLNAGLASHPPHTHRAEEIILMTRGSGEILIGDKPQKASAGDVVLLRANVPHAFTNTGPGPCGYFAIQWHSKAE